MNAFPFIKKLLIFTAGLVPIVGVLAVYTYRSDIRLHGFRSMPTNNFSNSISFNALVQNLHETNKINELEFLVLGSSMALNNVSAEMMEDSLHLKTYNFSSWGTKGPGLLRIIENIDFSNCRQVLLPFGNQDLNDSIQFEINNLPLINTYLRNSNNWVSQAEAFFYKFNFNNFLDTWKVRSRDLYKTNTYTSLKYGRCGSVLLDSTEFEISAKRYERYFDTTGFSSFFTNINSLHALLAKKNVTLTLVYLPWRDDLITPGRQQANNNVVAALKAKFGKHFINLNNLKIDKSLFCDGSHLFRPGAEMLTRNIIDSIRGNKKETLLVTGLNK